MGVRIQMIVASFFMLSGCELALAPLAVLAVPGMAVEHGLEEKRDNSESITVVDSRGKHLAGPPESRMARNSVFTVSPDAIVCKGEYLLDWGSYFKSVQQIVIGIDCDNRWVGLVHRMRQSKNSSFFTVQLTPVAGEITPKEVFAAERRYGPIIVECKQKGRWGLVDVDDEPILVSCKTYETKFKKNGHGKKGKNISKNPVPLAAVATEVLKGDSKRLTLWINP